MKGFFVKFEGPTGIPEVYGTFLTEKEAVIYADYMNDNYPNIKHWVEAVDFND